jgi:hypothetical protein
MGCSGFSDVGLCIMLCKSAIVIVGLRQAEQAGRGVSLWMTRVACLCMCSWKEVSLLAFLEIRAHCLLSFS